MFRNQLTLYYIAVNSSLGYWGFKMSNNTLIFVYNADSGIVNEMKDYFHKVISPSTYGCNLCAITYGNTGMKSEWNNFVNDLSIPTKFLHKDEFNEKYNETDPIFPCAYLENNNKLTLFISANEINSCKDLNELMSIVTHKIEEFDGS